MNGSRNLPAAPSRGGTNLPDGQYFPQGQAEWSLSGMTENGQSDIWSLQQLGFMVYSQWRLILATTGISLVLAVLYLLLATSLFTASVTLEFPGYSPVLSGSQIESAIAQRTQDQNYLATQVAKLRRLSVADRVLSDPEIEVQLEDYLEERVSVVKQWITAPLRWIQSSPFDELTGDEHFQHDTDFLRQYLQLVDVSPVHGTSLVEVSVTTAEPIFSRTLANGHSQGIIAQLQFERHERLQEKLTFLKEEGADLEERVAESERSLAAYAEEHELVSLTDDQNVVVKELGELMRLLSEAKSRRIQAESILNEIEGRPLEDTDALDTDAIRNILVKLNVTEAEYADLGRKVTPLYPRMQQLKARIDSLKGSITSQRGQARRRLEAEYNSSLQTEQELKNQIQLTNSQAHDVSRRLVQYNILKREYESLKDLHQSVIRQRKEVQLSSAHQGTEVLITDFAALPDHPSYPRKSLILIFALSLGGSVGIGIAVFRELFRTTIVSQEEVASHLHVPTLGSIPSFSSEDAILPMLLDGMSKTSSNRIGEKSTGEEETSEGESEEQESFVPVSMEQHSSDVIITEKAQAAANSPSFFRASEAFRTLSTYIMLSSADAPPTPLLVTSTLKGEGKTTVISNLAVSFARNEKKVLLIDADVRQPRLHRRFNIPASQAGLVDYLAGQVGIKEAIVQHSEYLYVLPAGSMAPSPAELFNSQKMRDLIQSASDKFDFVIVDAPPVLPVADALVLSRLVEGVLLVARSGRTRRRLAQEALQRLRSVRASILGVVLNDCEHATDPYRAIRSSYESSYYIIPDQNPEDGRRVVGQS